MTEYYIGIRSINIEAKLCYLCSMYEVGCQALNATEKYEDKPITNNQLSHIANFARHHRCEVITFEERPIQETQQVQFIKQMLGLLSDNDQALAYFSNLTPSKIKDLNEYWNIMSDDEKYRQVFLDDLESRIKFSKKK